ncbi:hypothetical protein TIFTF001_020613 [Ficus carica]|uniref:Uncharacterized protein n=1 Tax=Ficus carica TaxID=3494 RepID=A0AA88AGE6_FICCA|nr:hypothetical protein TIFTF001_020613 [Ficus carica]
MSIPTKMSEKNTTLEKRSVRVTAKSSKRSSADESSKNPVPAIERMVSDIGLKRKQGEMDVNDSKKLISTVEDKISKAEEFTGLQMNNKHRDNLSCSNSSNNCMNQFVGSYRRPLHEDNEFDRPEIVCRSSSRLSTNHLCSSSLNHSTKNPTGINLAFRSTLFNDSAMLVVMIVYLRPLKYARDNFIGSAYTSQVLDAYPEGSIWTHEVGCIFDTLMPINHNSKRLSRAD